MPIPQLLNAARSVLFGCLLFALAVPASAATTTGKLRDELAMVAGEVAKAIKGMGQDSVAVGQFVAPPQLSDATGGPGITKVLCEELEKLEVSVKRRAELGLEGVFRDGTNAEGRPATKIEGKLVDRSGRTLVTFTRYVVETETTTSLFGLTVDLPAKQSGKVRDRELTKSLEKPTTHLRSMRISAGPNCLYGIEIWVRDDRDYQPRTPTDEDGQAYVKISRGEIYAVRLINDSPHDAAVLLTIDGLPMFAFSEKKSYRHMIVAAGKSGLIKGWHRTNEVSDSFQVMEYSKSAAAELLPNSSSLGTITATFSAAWPEDQRPPSDEPSLGDRGSEGDATGRGPAVEQVYREVVRKIGVVRAAVSVRYNKK